MTVAASMCYSLNIHTHVQVYMIVPVDAPMYYSLSIHELVYMIVSDRDFS